MPNGSYGFDTNGRQIDETSSATRIWALILGAIQGAFGGGGAGGNGGVIISQPTGTPNFAPIAASSNANVPIGAKNWTFAILTGTGTVTCNSVSFAVAAAYSQSSQTTTAGHAINVATDSASTAIIYYET